MDKELDYMPIEDLIAYIHSFIISQKKSLDFSLYFQDNKWSANVNTYPVIKDNNLRDALYWLAMHLKNDKRDEFSYGNLVK